jgi:hypothetical protein
VESLVNLLQLIASWLGAFLGGYFLWKGRNAATKEDAKEIAYLTVKGQNLATKEDIQEMTQTVEGVKAAFTAAAEEHAQKNRLRLAAIDERLRVHQEAFVRCRTLRNAAFTPDVQSVAEDCRQWWEKNCLYLGADARRAFVDAIVAARVHKLLCESRASKEERDKNWLKFDECESTIVEVAGLPEFGDQEKKLLRENDEPQSAGSRT